MQTALEYFHGNQLPAQVWVDKYALKDEENKPVENTPNDMHRRLARQLAIVESAKFKTPFSEDFIFSLLENFGPIIPQGSVMYGVGNPRFVTLSNCYVIAPPSPSDSYGGICYLDEMIVQISKRRGGVGFDISFIRPEGQIVNNSAQTTSGILPFMERFSNSIREVGQNGRRGASLQSISVHHPQILDFINVKSDLKKVTGANISVKLYDEFLQALSKNQTYQLRWPVNSKQPEITREVQAKEVWRSIIHNAWKQAEPCLVFWDTIIRESPADCYAEDGFASVGLNPCAELIMCSHDSCRLLLLTVFYFVSNPFTPQAKFDWAKFYQYCQYAQRLMDDIVDLEEQAIKRIISKIDNDKEPESVKCRERELWEQILEKCQKGRRTGTGLTAIGDTLAALNIPYGSDQSIEMVAKIYQTLKFGCYKASVDMAKEIGPFPIWDGDKEKHNPFLNRVNDEQLDLGDEIVVGSSIYEAMQKYGRRNIAILTQSPAGSVSILAGPAPYFGTTSGIEPLFQPSYTRRKKITHSEINEKPDFVDANGDKWKEFTVYHPKLKMWMDITGETDLTKSPYYGSCAEDIDWKQRVKLQAAAQRHIDHSISSTLNLPEDVTEEKVAEIYEMAWRSGCKGITVYRKNCRTGVLVDKKEEKKEIVQTTAPKRPKELPCDIHAVSSNHKKYWVAVGLMNGQPYEVLVASAQDSGVQKPAKPGIISKLKRGDYKLTDGDGEVVCQNMCANCSAEEETITRLISTGLRHGADISFIVAQLQKTEGDLMSFAKMVGRVLKKYVKDGTKATGVSCPTCGNQELTFAEGCVSCSCGYSKCS